MKRPLVLCLFLISTLSFSQTDTFERTIDLGGKKVTIDAELVDQIKITNWTQAHVGVKVTYSINDGELNDILEVELDESPGRIDLKVELDKKRLKDSDFYDCDEEHTISWGGDGRKNRLCMDILVEVKVPVNTSVDVESVIGDLFITGVYQELYAKTVTGEIELSWPNNEGAEVKIKTVNGGIFTDHDFQMPQEKGLPLISSHVLTANVGNGGKLVNLETVTSDIYFKKIK